LRLFTGRGFIPTYLSVLIRVQDAKSVYRLSYGPAFIRIRFDRQAQKSFKYGGLGIMNAPVVQW